MRFYSPLQLEALQSGITVTRRMYIFNLPGGPKGFWDGTGTFTWNTVDFIGSDTLIEFTEDAETTGLEANGFSLKLFAKKNTALTPSVLDTIFDIQYRNTIVQVLQALFSKTTGLRIDEPIIHKSGYLHSVTKHSSDRKTWIEGKCISRRRDLQKSGVAMANSVHHAAVAPGDKFFDSVSTISRHAIAFGGETPPAPAVSNTFGTV